jgi:hypothetical protein
LGSSRLPAQDRLDDFGRKAGQAFFTKAGKLRDGLVFLTEKTALSPPWAH